MRFFLFVLLLFAAVPLFAQRIPVFVNEVTGTGSTPEDNLEFESLLNRELRARGFFLSEMQADYYFSAVISPSVYEEGKFYLSITLYNYDDEELIEEGIFYATLDEAKSQLPGLLFNILSSVWDLRVYIAEQERLRAEGEKEYEEPVDPEAWRRQPWYFSIGAFWNPRMYYGKTLEDHLLNFGFGVAAEFHFLQFAEQNEKLKFLEYLGAGTGLELANDWIVASPRLGDQYWNSILQIPLLIKGVIRPGTSAGEDAGNSQFMHQPYAGFIFNIPFYTGTKPFPVSWTVGYQFNVRGGEGIFYADARYAMDLGKSDVTAKRLNQDTPQYDRFMLYLGIGYKRDYNLSAAVQGIIHNLREKAAAKKLLKESQKEPEAFDLQAFLDDFDQQYGTDEEEE